MTEPTLPTPVVTVGGEDLTDRIDLDSLQRTMTERGEASCLFDITLSDENDVPTNALVRDAVVTVHVEGALRWYGHIVNVSQPQPGDPVITVEAAGQWDLLHQKEDYCKGFVETRVENLVQYPENIARTSELKIDANNSVSVDTSGQFLAVNPGKATYKGGYQGQAYYLWLADGMSSQSIRRVTWTPNVAVPGESLELMVVMFADPWTIPVVLAWTVLEDYLTNTTTPYDSGDWGVDSGLQALAFLAYANAANTSSSDDSIQIRDLKIYYDRITAPTVDSAALEIWTDITGLTDSVTETIGSPLTQLMIDPFTDGADAIGQVLAKATTPPLCGVIHNQFRCINRPTAPTDNTRLFVVSDQLTPGLEWQVTPDTAGSKDYVALTYTQIIASPTTTPSGLPARMYYSGGTDYSTPASNTARIALIDSGTELTDTEAAAAARQAYGYYHNFVQGTVTIPYSCHNGNGQAVSIEHIECWDWVYNAGKANTAEAGPFLISEVSIQGGVAVLTIGATEGYNYESPYRMPTKGRYVGAHRQRTSHLLYRRWYQKELRRKWRQYLKTSKSGTRTWKTFSAYAKAHPAPKHHPKYHNTYKNVEGRYV